MTDRLLNIHPGQILFEEFRVIHDISQNRLAKDIDVSERRINEIIMVSDLLMQIRLRLSGYFGTSP